jgi:hypothetical protein
MTIPSTPPAHQAAAAESHAAKPQTAAPKPAPKEDTVKLSPAAQAASSGDVDHDGDSH